MNTSEFEQYKVEHLFLLVGENPLPNYVAAKLLLHQGGTAYLVHTTDTLDEAKRLKKSFESEPDKFNVELRSLNNYESDAYYIQKEIATKLKSINSGKIGLNYTGGTKAMSAHSYRTLFYEEIPDKTGKVYRRRKDIIFSYLDPRKLEICIDREDNERERLKVKPDTLELKLETLFELHGLILEKLPSQEAQLLELAEELVNFFADKNKITQWFDWYDNIFCKQARRDDQKKKSQADLDNLLSPLDKLPLEIVEVLPDKQLLISDDNLALVKVTQLLNWYDNIFSQEARNDNRKWKNNTDLAKLVIPLDKLPSEIIEAFRKAQLLSSDNKLALLQAKNISFSTKLEDFCKFLDGIWLEHYTLQQIKNIANSQSIKQYGLDFKIPLEGTTDGFQFDVAFTRGYQLFAISCTTASKRDICKSKLFEAYLRAKQMGGEEARVALVCCSDEPDTLKAEIVNTLSKKKIAVFGRTDLLNLSDNIINWIKENDREAK